jgi:hypothetical protein
MKKKSHRLFLFPPPVKYFAFKGGHLFYNFHRQSSTKLLTNLLGYGIVSVEREVNSMIQLGSKVTVRKNTPVDPFGFRICPTLGQEGTVVSLCNEDKDVLVRFNDAFVEVYGNYLTDGLHYALTPPDCDCGLWYALDEITEVV